MPDPQSLHQRYELQAEWTAQIRRRLYALADLRSAAWVLEVGCGTGVICGGIDDSTSAKVIGLDIDAAALQLAKTHYPQVQYLQADGMQLPLPTGSIDISLCHFLLLWLDDPSSVLDEMFRVTRPGGSVMALAEPDYGGRVDYPDVLHEMGEMQIESLRRQGADPLIGRRLRALFQHAGLEAVQVGVLGGEWTGSASAEAFDSEWATWRDDVAEMLSRQQLLDYRQQAVRAWRSQGHILFVPTFYAIGRVPSPPL